MKSQLFYSFRGKGLALSAEIVVMAGNLPTAEKYANQWAVENQVDPNELQLIKIDVLKSPSVVYGWNGDY